MDPIGIILNFWAGALWCSFATKKISRLQCPALEMRPGRPFGRGPTTRYLGDETDHHGYESSTNWDDFYTVVVSKIFDVLPRNYGDDDQFLTHWIGSTTN